MNEDIIANLIGELNGITSLQQQFDFLDLNKEKLTEKGLYEEEYNDKFYNVYNLYSYFLSLYIDEKIELSSKESMIENGSLDIKPVPKNKMDIYQKLSPFKYFYVRNSLNIEKLPQDFIEELNDRVLNKSFEYDIDAKTLIEQTYEEVITNSKYSDGTNINYGPTTTIDYFAPNNALVLGIRYEQYNTETIDNDEELLQNYLQKRGAMETLKELVKFEAKDKFKTEVYTIIYHDDSVITEDYIKSIV